MYWRWKSWFDHATYLSHTWIMFYIIKQSFIRSYFYTDSVCGLFSNIRYRDFFSIDWNERWITKKKKMVMTHTHYFRILYLHLSTKDLEKPWEILVTISSILPKIQMMYLPQCVISAIACSVICYIIMFVFVDHV